MLLISPRPTLFPYTTLFRSLLAGRRPAVRNGAGDRLCSGDVDPGDRRAGRVPVLGRPVPGLEPLLDRKSTRLNSSHANSSYAVFCLKKNKNASSPTV